MRSKRSTLTFRLSLSAAFLALALICKMFFSIPISFLGVGGIRIGFAGIFTAFPAILFGPIYGGAVSALSDLLGALIKPEGAYIPWLTVTAFMGGFLKGLIFRFILHPKAFRIFSKSLAIFFLLVGILGGILHIQLVSDDVIRSFPTTKEQVPLRHEIDEMSLSSLSKTMVDLAHYNKDNYTLTQVTKTGDIIIPSQVLLHRSSKESSENINVQIWNYGGKINKIGANAFKKASPSAHIYIPSSVTSIDKNAFANRTDLVICAKVDSVAHKFAMEHNLIFEETAVKNQPVYVDCETLQNADFSLRSSDTYRKYLSGYLNSLTLGLELVGILGLCSFLYLTFKKKTDTIGGYQQIFLSVTLSGLLVTTINTQILRVFTAAWNDRAFWILWVPRVAEELIVCSIQAYFILFLYTIYKKKIKPRSVYLKNLKF